MPYAADRDRRAESTLWRCSLAGNEFGATRRIWSLTRKKCKKMSIARAVVKLEAHGNRERRCRVGRGPPSLVGSPWLARADRDGRRDRLHGAAHAPHDGAAALDVDG